MTSRLLAGRALRFQPDGRLVSLVRDGYDSAFEEIFRRYGAALRSYAASIVKPQRADDVTQDAFTKAYLALRGTDKEIQLRPWLYRIVRNTALTNIRDEPSAAAELDATHATGTGPVELAEQREEIKRLMAGLRKLPEPQRAAIVMRELEGLSHGQIAASLGLSGGAVRQSIYRARRALREGMGMLLPMPMLRLLLDEGFGQGASATAAGGGAGIAVKTGLAALLAAGTVTTGAVLNNDLKPTPDAQAKATKTRSGGRDSPFAGLALNEARRLSSGSHGEADRRGGHRGAEDGNSGHSGDSRRGSQHSGSGSGSGSGTGDSRSGSSGSGSSGSGSSGSGSSGSGSSGPGSDDLSASEPGLSAGSGSDDVVFESSGSSTSGSGSSGPGPGPDGGSSRSSGSDDPLL